MRVLRLDEGDRVAVFNGCGEEWHGRIQSATPAQVFVALEVPAVPVPEARVAITLVQAVLKGERMDDVVRDAVMLGVTRVQPVLTTRTETSRAALLRGGRPERWRRIVLSSTKQCRRATRAEVCEPMALETWLTTAREPLRLFCAEPGASPDTVPVQQLTAMPRPGEAALVVGPEGGWTAEECACAAQSGARLVSFGARVLRADAVPLTALSILQFLWDGPW